MELAAKAVELVSLLRSECAQQELKRAKAFVDKWNAAGDRKKLREADARHAAITQILSNGKLEMLSAAVFAKVVRAGSLTEGMNLLGISHAGELTMWLCFCAFSARYRSDLTH